MTEAESVPIGEELLARIEATPKARRNEAALDGDILEHAAQLRSELDLARFRARLQALGVAVRPWTKALAERRAKTSSVSTSAQPAEEWRAKLSRDEYGAIRGNSPRNAASIVRNWAPFETLRQNLLTLELELDGNVFRETDVTRWRTSIETTWGAVFPADLLFATLAAVAEDRAYHPVRDYLASLVWDGVPRLDRIAPDILDAGSDPLTVQMVRRFLIAAVARALEPGCQVDTALVLYSQEQGRKKTTFFRTLAGPGWWSAGHIDPSDKDTILRAHQSWIVIADEVDALMRGHDSARIKRWMSDTVDSIRPPYGRVNVRLPRGFVIGATTNEQEFLNDPTGSRRWWIVSVGPADPDARIALLASWRDQLWAEAVVAYHAYKAGDTSQQWWLDTITDEERERAAITHQVTDVWDERIEEWLAKPRAPNQPIRTIDILTDACRVSIDRLGEKAHERRVGRTMRRLGYESRTVRIHGTDKPVRAWVKASRRDSPIAEDDRERAAIQADAIPPG